MTIHLRKRLAEDTEYYDKDPIEKYAEYLKEEGRIVRIDNLLFDGKALGSTLFVCDSGQCIPSDPKKIKKNTCCCSVYAPRLSTRERERIDEILPALKERFSFLEKAIEKAGGFFEWDEGYDRMVSKDKRGLCVFMTPSTEEFGFYGCTIHSWCLENKKSPWDYKPSACVMFPLFLLDLSNDEEELIVTAQSREVMTLGEENDDNYCEVGCLKKKGKGKEPVYIAMKDTLVNMFGSRTWTQLDKALRERGFVKVTD
jgi:hypothetical protein